MHVHTLDNWRHDHDFLSTSQERNARRTHWVILLTAVTMGVEIAAGLLFGSMALLADGWHMASHAAALMITAFAYRHARLHARDPAYAFGPGKVGALGGFASAVTLGIVALLMAGESTERLFNPHRIDFDAAMWVAAIGLAVNLLSAKLLHASGDHHGDDHHRHDSHRTEAKHSARAGHHHDHNLRAAFFHVLADALTSVLAIAALLIGKHWGWQWVDPLMGVAGAILVGSWSIKLMRESGAVLLDRTAPPEALRAIAALIEADADNRVADIHLWEVGQGRFAVILTVVTHQPRNPDHYKALLTGRAASVPVELAHVTVEVQACAGESCLPAAAKRA